MRPTPAEFAAINRKRTLAVRQMSALTPPAIQPRLPSAAVLLGSRWLARKITIEPFGPSWWSFNPSVHHDRVDGVWRVVLRCANYSLPDGIPQLSRRAKSGRAETRNVLARLDPETLELSRLREIRELDSMPRAATCASIGYEDVRLFRTQRDGLCGVASALQLNLEHPSCPEVVLLRLNPDGDIVDASPIRGAWSYRPQKNWSPFDDADEPRFMYSIERGVVMTELGPASGSTEPMPDRSRDIAASQTAVDRSTATNGRSCGVEVRVMPAGTRALRGTPGPAPNARRPEPRPGSTELRGGSQLSQIGPNRWLGIAHEMEMRREAASSASKKFYWHTLYTVSSNGTLLERSAPFKLSPTHGIEFAAGLAIDGRGGVAISYGTDDHDSWIGVTDLSAIERVLRPVTR